MPKIKGFKEGQTVYDGPDDFKLTPKKHPTWETKDISKKVDENASRNSGSSAKLTSDE